MAKRAAKKSREAALAPDAISNPNPGLDIDNAILEFRELLISKGRKPQRGDIPNPKIPFESVFQKRTPEDAMQIALREGMRELSADVIARTRAACSNNIRQVDGIITKQFFERNLRDFAGTMRAVQNYISRWTMEDGNVTAYYGHKNFTKEVKPSYAKARGITLYTFLKEIYPKIFLPDREGLDGIDVAISKMAITNVEEFINRPISDIIRQLEEAGY